MNCDQVFDVLTRGPFPTGNVSDASVERHLAACHECRELAVALEPAVQLLHESLSSHESPSLPGYQGIYSESSVACLPAALQAALDDDAPVAANLAVAPAAASRRADLWRMTGVLSLGAMLGALLLGVVWQAPRALPSFAAVSPAANQARELRFQPSESGRQWLVSLSLPSVCLPASPPAALPTASPRQQHSPAHAISELEALFACCLECHAASNPRRPSMETQASLDRSCHVCHNY